jgi:mRNA interferase RelE/StbE
MIYELAFHPEALKEWVKLDPSVRSAPADVTAAGVQKETRRTPAQIHPRVPAAQLSGRSNRYKIKLRTVGYRLVYEVRDAELLILVVAVGKRDRNAVYRIATNR